MSGKRKQAQRRKNNVRPSSSGRSAELLGTNVTNFINFSTIEESGYVSVLPEFSEDFDSSISLNFQRVLKMMNKKDSITKTKALDSFGKLCRESESSAVKVILPFWSHLYCVLATDYEHRVREAAHFAHLAVVSSVGRNIAPYLKHIAGAWFTSQYDTYAPAASAALLSFQEAFPPNKITEAIIFCEEEILNYIYDNLINKNSDETQIKMSKNYKRVLVSSLRGYAMYLARLPEEQIRKREEMNKKLIESSKFWEYAKHDTSIIKAAWFTALVNLCQNAPFLLNSEKKRVIVTVFNNLDESDPIVLPVIWEASLHTVVTFEDWFEYVNVEKLVFPKLWRILREGGLGNAATIFPNILPLLSKIPPSLIPDKELFYSKFFLSLFEGTKQRTVQQSLVESDAVVECFMECLSFNILKNIDDLTFCTNLLSNQLMAVLEATMKDSKLKLTGRAFYNKLSCTLIQWSRQTHKNYAKLLEVVWNKLLLMCRDTINSSILDKRILVVVLNAQHDMLSGLKSYKINTKKYLKVTFSDDNDPQAKTPLEDQVSALEDQVSVTVLDDLPDTYKCELENFVQEIVKTTFHYISVNESHRHLFIEHLSKIIILFDTSDLLTFVTSVTGENKKCSDFYNEYIYNWLSDTEVAVEDVLNLSFTLLKYVQDEEEEKECIMKSLSQVDAISSLAWCLRDNNINKGSVKKWLLKQNSILESLIDQVLVDKSETREYYIVKKCLSSNDQSDFLLKYETVICLLRKLVTAVDECSRADNDINVYILDSLLKEGFKTILQCGDSSLYVEDLADLITTCFNYCLNQPTDINQRGLVKMVRFVSAISCDHGIYHALYKTFLVTVTEFIYSRDNLTIIEMQKSVKQIAVYLHELKQRESTKVDQAVDDIINEILTQTRNKWDDSLLQLCFRAEVLNGLLSSNDKIESTEKRMDLVFYGTENVNKCITYALFSNLLVTETREKNFAGDDLDKYLLSCHLDERNLNHYTEYLADSILKIALFRICKHNFSTIKQFYEVSDKISNLDEILEVLTLSSEGPKEVEKYFIARGVSSSYPGLWAEALFIFHADFLKTEDLCNALTRIQDENRSNALHFSTFWLPQVFPGGNIVEEVVESQTDNDLLLLCFHLRTNKCEKQSMSFQTQCSMWLEKIVTMGKLSTFELDLSNVADSEIEFSANIAEFLSLMVQYYPDGFNRTSWDCPMICTASWISSLKKTISSGDHIYSSLTILHFACAVCRLFKVMSTHMSSVNVEDTAVSSEWKDVFLSDMQKFITEVWVSISDHFQDRQSVKPELLLILLNELSEIIRNIIDVNLFIEAEHSSIWLDICCRNMQSHITEIQFSAYNLFVKLIPLLISSDAKSEEVQNEAANEENTSVQLTCGHLQDALKHTQTIVDTVLSELRLCDTCIMEPFTDSYTCTRSYLFLWLAILELCNGADSQLRFMYTGWIKENQFLGYLMKCLFCLMPEEAVHHKGEILPTSNIREMFYNPPDMPSALWDSKTLSHLSCWTYYKLLGQLPAAVRQWWGELDHKLANLVERFTSTFVSPQLCRNEMEAVIREGKGFQSMNVLVHPTAREVEAVYTVEESSTELIIQLPTNHPLGPPKVKSGKYMVSSNQTRQWVMKLSLFLTHQNGTIWDGLVLWKNALDKKFEGVEECYICFAVLHNVSQQLPKLSCQTCKKKFHSACLYKWFTTSNKSTCPICRNMF